MPRSFNINVRQLLNEIRDNPANFDIQPFSQSFNIGTLNSGASTTVNSNVDASAAFVWLKTSYFGAIADAAQTENTRVIPLVTAQLTDSGSSRQLLDQPQPFEVIAGHGGIPLLAPQPYLFQPNSNIQGQFANFDAAANYTSLFLTLLGFRVYV